MKTKTRASKFCLKRQRTTATTRPLPALNLETHAQISKSSDDTDKDNSFNNDEVISDSLDKNCVSPHNSVEPSEDSERMDLFESESFCVKCNNGGDLLVCSNSDCPVSIHKDCLTCEPKYDLNGKFYCPYCWYKILVAKTKELRRKAMLSKKDLSSFIDSKMVADDVEKGAPIVITGSGRLRNCNGCETETNQSEDKAESNLDKSGKDGEEIQVECSNSKQVDSGQHDGVDVDRENRVLEDEEPIQAKSPAFFTTEDEIQDFSHDALSKEVSNSVSISEDSSKRTVADERPDIVPENPREDPFSYESSESYNMPRKRRLVKKRSKRKAEVENVSKSPPQWKKCRIVDSPKRKSPLVYSPANGSSMNESKNPKTLRQPCQSTSKISSLAVVNRTRKKTIWTFEEEEKLKEGVKHFSTSINKNIPWRKILEYGRDVFEATRNPSDLKDKWKLIISK